MDLSAVYFDVLKDRLYTSAPKSQARRSAQTALYRLLDALVRLLAPILSFTPKKSGRIWARGERSHGAISPSPASSSAGIGRDLRKRAANWDRLMEVRDDVLKSLETARKEKLIGAPLEARVRLSANGDLYPLLEQYAAELPGLFIVSQVELDVRARSDLARASGARGGHQVRALLEVHGRCRLRFRHFPRSARRAPGRSDETLHG